MLAARPDPAWDTPYYPFRLLIPRVIVCVFFCRRDDDVGCLHAVRAFCVDA